MPGAVGGVCEKEITHLHDRWRGQQYRVLPAHLFLPPAGLAAAVAALELFRKKNCSRASKLAPYWENAAHSLRAFHRNRIRTID